MPYRRTKAEVSRSKAPHPHGSECSTCYPDRTPVVDKKLKQDIRVEMKTIYPEGLFWEDILFYGKSSGNWLYKERMDTLSGKWDYIYGGIDILADTYIPWIELDDPLRTKYRLEPTNDVEQAKRTVEDNYIPRRQ